VIFEVLVIYVQRGELEANWFGYHVAKIVYMMVAEAVNWINTSHS
jgi:hypothetical protein